MASIKHKYTTKLGIKIAKAIQNHADSLEKICKLYDDFPTAQAIRWWLTKNKYPEFTALYKRAKMNQSHLLVDKMIDVANDAQPDKWGKVEKAALQIKTYQWICARLNPRKYSEKLELQEDENKKETDDSVKIEFIKKTLQKAIDRKMTANDRTES